MDYIINAAKRWAEATRRVDMEFGIGYSDDIDKAKFGNSKTIKQR
ncbi:hypothetical protein ASZ90_004254 [hydrocarbon metagenome]|uniref:Uncharacterized protein n=1 Tax=hydrocarbon metagenome TaxID=938273 RepID=A0A0W8FYE5_9ZZZZ